MWGLRRAGAWECGSRQGDGEDGEEVPGRGWGTTQVSEAPAETGQLPLGHEAVGGFQQRVHAMTHILTAL